jgi:hypothetical protein
LASSVNSGSGMGRFGGSYCYILRDPRYGHYKQGDPRYDSKPEFTDVQRIGSQVALNAENMGMKR